MRPSQWKDRRCDSPSGIWENGASWFVTAQQVVPNNLYCPKYCNELVKNCTDVKKRSAGSWGRHGKEKVTVQERGGLQTLTSGWTSDQQRSHKASRTSQLLFQPPSLKGLKHQVSHSVWKEIVRLRLRNQEKEGEICLSKGWWMGTLGGVSRKVRKTGLQIYS